MARTTWDRIWFGTAAILFAYGTLAWWTEPVGSDWAQPRSMMAIWLSAGALALGWWRWSSAANEAGRWAVAPLVLAVTAPLSMVPMVDFRDHLSSLAGLLIASLAVVPLAIRISDRVTEPTLRRRTMLSVGVLAAAAAIGTWWVGHGDIEPSTRWLRWSAVAATTMVPAIVVARELLSGPQRTPVAAPQRSLGAIAVVAIGVLPAVAAVALTMRGWPILVIPVAAAGLTAVWLGWFAVVPLARIASRASGQRDRVVAAAEAERERLAFALHDGALAEVTLLIQRLDQQGDTPSAAIARGIADELRGLGSELRLPILDDLGTGPALEWLTGRLAQRSGIPVGLQQSTAARPPAPVELAAYRVAQEALVNAIKHGGAPIRVEYTATLGRVVLCVDDAGPGIDRDAPARAEREGRLGIVSMAQRAEAIGARLALSARPEGGTRVRLEWQAT